jgi:molybdopterin synthase sulfur carrier subunit
VKLDVVYFAWVRERIGVVRVAVDQTLSDFDAPLKGVRELAFFPPMTGG